MPAQSVRRGHLMPTDAKPVHGTASKTPPDVAPILAAMAHAEDAVVRRWAQELLREGEGAESSPQQISDSVGCKK